ncbi:MAG: transglycosylase SLT domain-containing protein [Actinomycetota bacterium]|nr:transglycosylase SLT domain-containing protein [Actinomycetota bacterium]
MLVTSIGPADGADATAAVALMEVLGPDEPGVLIQAGAGKSRPATLISNGKVKEVESAVRDVVDGEQTVEVKVRGRLCVVNVDVDHEVSGDSGGLDGVMFRLTAILDAVGEGVPCAVVCAAAVYRQILDRGVFSPECILLRTDPDSGDATKALGDLTVGEAFAYADRVELVDCPPGRLVARRALAGAAARRPGRVSRPGSTLVSDSGQATPMVLGAIFVLVLGTIALVAIAGAITGKARAQTVADLSALSAARSMKDDLPRLLAPPTLPNGLPNPAHMPKPVYLARARLTAIRIAVSNGASPLRVTVRFPDRFSFAPVRTRVVVRSRVEAGRRTSGTEDWAEARVGAPVSMGTVPPLASGGGYAGPLAERQGQGMRPDVAAAFDEMAASAGAAGVTLTINSAFRSDAEQAALFAANPDPTWVARPGTSLHRCATELDLGASDGYAWLAANASRFGFVQRYSWEAWHYGFTAGPEPCSAAGNSVGAGDPRNGLAGSLPSFVPKQFHRPILASAMKWGVSAALLAAQLYAESNFDPDAGSPAGAQGIAQFMPATAASYGLTDPYDPVAAIDAQGHLMSDLLKQFGSPALALAAYNAGPGAVSPCSCIPDYPETQAYVAKILALLSGVGSIVPMPMEVELVK